MITFNNNKTIETSKSQEKPILHIDKITFNTNDQEWRNRLSIASMKFKTTGYNDNDQFLKSNAVTFSLGPFVGPKKQTPVFNINKLVTFIDSQNIINDEECHHWITSIKVNNLNFQDNETLNVILQDNT